MRRTSEGVRGTVSELKLPGPFFEFKDERDCAELLKNLQPEALIVFAHFAKFCRDNRIPCMVTNLFRRFPQSKSYTHPEGRAFDASIRGWTETNVQDCIAYMILEVNHLGAYSLGDRRQRVVVRHDVGLGDHLHFQVARRP